LEVLKLKNWEIEELGDWGIEGLKNSARIHIGIEIGIGIKIDLREASDGSL